MKIQKEKLQSEKQETEKAETLGAIFNEQKFIESNRNCVEKERKRTHCWQKPMGVWMMPSARKI